MARGFGATFGAGSTDSVKGGYTSAPASKSTFYARVWRNGAGGGNLGHIIDQNNGGNGSTFGILLDDNTVNVPGTLSVAYGFTSSFGQWQFTAPSNSAWHSIVSAYDGTSTSNMPSVYIDGSTTTVTQIGTPSGSFGTGSANWYFGNRADGTRNWDGKLAECALWNKVLTASEVQALAHGIAPYFLQPASLVFYLPMLGVGSGEPDWGPSHLSQTLTGTAKVSHPPVGFWMPPVPGIPGISPHFTGSLALAQGASSAAIAQSEKFAGHLSFAQPANTTGISGLAEALIHTGRVTVSDATQGGLLALTDTALYDVQISESI